MVIPSGKRYGEETYKALRLYRPGLPSWESIGEEERNIWDSVAASTIQSYFERAKTGGKHYVF